MDTTTWVITIALVMSKNNIEFSNIGTFHFIILIESKV